MKKQKKEKTVKELERHNRTIQYGLFASEFAVIPIPFAIMSAVNYEEWFVNNPDSWKIGLGGSLAIALMSIAVFLVGAKKENKELTGGYIAIILGWYAFAFIAMLLSQILSEIYNIMFIGGTGMLAAFGLDIGSKRFKIKADKNKTALQEAEKELAKERAKEEMVRIKVKDK